MSVKEEVSLHVGSTLNVTTLKDLTLARVQMDISAWAFFVLVSLTSLYTL